MEKLSNKQPDYRPELIGNGIYDPGIAISAPQKPQSPIEMILNRLEIINKNSGELTDLLYESKVKFLGESDEKTHTYPESNDSGMIGDIKRQLDSLEYRIDSLYKLASEIRAIF